MHIEGPEPRECPAEYQDRLVEHFGLNRYGTPNFRFVWGQSNTIRMGNVWRDKFGNESRGYRDVYQSFASPCWIIQRWKAPEEYGTPELYYMQTWDEFSRLFAVGEYPWAGRYETVQMMQRQEVVNGRLEIEHFELSHILIDKIIPLIQATQELSLEQRRAALQAIDAAEQKKQTEEITEMMMNNLPSYYGPVSFSKQGCRTSLLDRKMYAIQKAWDRLSRGGARPDFRRGFQQANRPVIKRFVN
jgi:hypothetical protein